MPGTSLPLISFNKLEYCNLLSSCSASGTSNKTLMSKSASLRYLFVSIEPINDVSFTGASFSNSFICLSIMSKTFCFSLGFSVSALSNTPGA